VNETTPRCRALVRIFRHNDFPGFWWTRVDGPRCGRNKPQQPTGPSTSSMLNLKVDSARADFSPSRFSRRKAHRFQLGRDTFEMLPESASLDLQSCSAAVASSANHIGPLKLSDSQLILVSALGTRDPDGLVIKHLAEPP
jgi:hypothetical protein